MSDPAPQDQTAPEQPDDTGDREPVLAERVEALEAENERLRRVAAAAQRKRYRWSALAMVVSSLLALGGAALFPDVRTVLIALSGTGLFAAILTYFLTPERFVAASVGQGVYGALADNEAAIVDDLQLRGDPVVLPATGSRAPARLFVPIDSETSLPDETDLDAPFVVDGQQGLALQPTGAPLYETVTNAVETFPDEPSGIARTVADALVEQFELVDAVDVDDEPGRVTLAVEGSAYGPVDRFDHPVASLLATTLAVELETPVTVTVDSPDDDGEEWLVTCRWDTETPPPATE